MTSSCPGTSLFLTNKRKRLSDIDEDGVRKVTKSGVCAKPPSSKLPLRIVTDISTLEIKAPALDELSPTTASDADSLFDDGDHSRLSTPEVDKTCFIPTMGEPSDSGNVSIIPARRAAPSIRGLYFDPTILLSDVYGDELMWMCIRTFFQEGSANQVMLFERVASPDRTSGSPTGLPSFLFDLLLHLHDLLLPAVPSETHDLLFSPSPASYDGPPRARQAIINLYWPGEGITPHVDLLDRYGDGIMGVSLGSGCAMDFAKVPLDKDTWISAGDPSRCALYLPKGSVLVMTEEARYGWTHGIEKRFDDLVENYPGREFSMTLERDVRLSITFRWLLPGADMVGDAAD